MEEQKQAPGWNRHELNLRLTKRRVAQLRAIAARLPGAPTPTEALDHAIARSIEERHGPLELDAVEEAVADLARRLGERLAALEAATRETARSCAALHSLIAEALSASEDDA